MICNREEELALLTLKSPRDYLEDAAPAIAAACSRQPALLELVGANLLMGSLTPHPFVQAVGDYLLQNPESKVPKANNHVAFVVTKTLLESLASAEQEALIKLNVLPDSFTLEAATVVCFSLHAVKQLSIRQLICSPPVMSVEALCCLARCESVWPKAHQQVQAVASIGIYARRDIKYLKLTL